MLRFLATATAVALLGAACAGDALAPPAGADGGAAGAPDADPAEPDLPRDVTVHVDLDDVGSTVASDLIGFSLEYPLVGSHLGRTPDQLNAVFLQLLENLGAGTLRVGGTSTDTSCWRPTPDATLPTGCSIEISANALRVIAATMREVGWRALLGVDLAHYSPTTALDFARDGVVPAFAAEPTTLLGLQFGHEPNLYATQNRRAAGYGHDDFIDEWMAYATALAGDATTSMLRPVGPTYGSRSAWYELLRDFLDGTGDMLGGLVAVNDSSLSNCGSDAPTLEQLMAGDTIYQSRKRMTDVAEALAPLGAELQIGQASSVQCLGVDGVSNVFGSALWAVDYVFTMVEAGARRVNFHHARNAFYNAIVSLDSDADGDGQFTYSTRVLPIYYGLLFASRAAGGRLLHATTADGSFALAAHAVRDPDGNTLVYLVNKDMEDGGTVAVTPTAARGPATAILLAAPELTSRAADVRLGSAALDATGAIGAAQGTVVRPSSSRGTYMVEVPYSSAVLLIIPPG
jgi:hypothetical protein